MSLWFYFTFVYYECSHGLSEGFYKVLSTWQKLRVSLHLFLRLSGCMLTPPPPPPPRNFLKSGPLRVHFQHSGAKTRVFELNTDILNSMTFFIQRQHMDNFYFYLFLLPLLL